MKQYEVTIKVVIDAEDDNEAHEAATRFCDTIGNGKRGEVVEVYADRVIPLDNEEYEL